MDWKSAASKGKEAPTPARPALPANPAARPAPPSAKALLAEAGLRLSAIPGRSASWLVRLGGKERIVSARTEGGGRRCTLHVDEEGNVRIEGARDPKPLREEGLPYDFLHLVGAILTLVEMPEEAAKMMRARPGRAAADLRAVSSSSGSTGIGSSSGLEEED
jgi:hypothetical protein